MTSQVRRPCVSWVARTMVPAPMATPTKKPEMAETACTIDRVYIMEPPPSASPGRPCASRRSALPYRRSHPRRNHRRGTDLLLKCILMGHPPRRDRRGFFVAYGMKHRLNRLSLGAASRVIPLPPVSV